MKALYSLLLPLLASALPADSPEVDLGYSIYRGIRLSAGIDQYVGMRFAAPPLGHLRFRAPRDPVQESSIQDAVTVGCPKSLSPISLLMSHVVWTLLSRRRTGGLCREIRRLLVYQCVRTLECNKPACLGVHRRRGVRN